MSFITKRGAYAMPEFDKRALRAAGYRNADLFVASHDAPPLYTKSYAQTIRALEGDPEAMAALDADLTQGD